MLRTVEAVIDAQGHVHVLEPPGGGGAGPGEERGAWEGRVPQRRADRGAPLARGRDARRWTVPGRGAGRLAAATTLKGR